MRTQTLRNARWLTGGPGSRGLSTTYPGFVDAFPGATGAYSFRKVRANYTGNAVLLRRDWDNAELAFGFVGGFFDVAGADAWIHEFDPGTIAYGKTWYDQSGNGHHFSQSSSTPSAQPIYTTSAGRPAFNFPSRWFYSSTDDGVSSDIPLSAFMSSTDGYVVITGSSETLSTVMFSDDGGFVGMRIIDGSPDTYTAEANDGSLKQAALAWDDPLWQSRHTYEWVHGGGNLKGCIDGGSDTSVAAGAITDLTNFCFINADSSSFSNGLVWEVGIYPTTPPRAGLVANMLAY